MMPAELYEKKTKWYEKIMWYEKTTKWYENTQNGNAHFLKYF